MEANREITLVYRGNKNTDDVRRGFYSQGYKVKLKDGSLAELKISTIPTGTRLRVYYMAKSRKVNGQKEKFYEIFRMSSQLLTAIRRRDGTFPLGLSVVGALGLHKSANERARLNSRHPQTPSAVSKTSVLYNFLQALLAVILGNVVYFVLIPSLPPAARHHPMHLDLGMVLDFWFCLVAYGLIRTARKWR